MEPCKVDLSDTFFETTSLENFEISKKLQSLAFRNGFGWSDGRRIFNSNVRYLYFEEDKIILYGTAQEAFEISNLKEIKWQGLLKERNKFELEF